MPRRFASVLVLGLVLASCRDATSPPIPGASAIEARNATRGETAREQGPDAGTPSDAPVSFEIVDGRIQNQFFRQGHVAAHVLATSGTRARLVFAFPAGNMGAGVWFDPTTAPVSLTLRDRLQPVERPDGLRGVVSEVHASARTLHVRRALLGSVRVLRRFDHDAAVPEGGQATVAGGPTVVLRRTTRGGYHHLELDLEPLSGTTIKVDADGGLTLAAPPSGDGEIVVRVTALADDKPLTPVPVAELFGPGGPPDQRLADVLAFLSYREKLLAGSWQYLTYFGRDTLLSSRLLLPALRPALMEAALGSVIERLSPDGEVAHEEEIGEFAVARNLKESAHPEDVTAARYDYKMIDDDFLLAPVLAEYLLGSAEARGRAPAFLARRTKDGRTYAEALRKNLARVLRQATPFAEKRSATRLIALEEGKSAGEWRDSNTGLGGGRYPYDVNVALVPAALSAATRLTESAFLPDKELAANARKVAAAWQHTETFFRVELPAAEAKKRVLAYATEIGVDGKEAAAAVDGPLVLRAVALDAEGAPIPIMSSDDGFVFLFGEPDPAMLEEAAKRLLRPFPLGLRTPVGVVVANAAFVPDPALRKTFGRSDYHGSVVWSWQQALLAEGLKRQLGRSDLPAPTRALLESADKTLWGVIHATKEGANAELWSFRIEQGKYVRVPFGQDAEDATESNAAQLWSTVYLSVRPR